MTEDERREDEEGIMAMEEEEDVGIKVMEGEEAASFEVVAKECKVLGFRRWREEPGMPSKSFWHCCSC